MGTNVSERLRICLVGGSGRSGTTVPGEAFSLRADVAWPEEARFVTDPDGIVDFYVTFASGWWSPTLYSIKVRRLARVLRAVGKRTPVQRTLLRVLNRARLTKRLPRIVVPAYGEVGLERTCPPYRGLVERLLADLVEFTFAARWTGSRLFEPTSLDYHAPFADGELRRLLGGFVRDVLEAMASRRGALAVVEDSPWNFLWFDKILELLPDARLVHVYRDPRDIVASFRGQRWAPTDPAQGARWLSGIMRQWRVVRARLPRDSYMEISLEDIVTSPERALREIGDFWGLPWDEAVLRADLSRSNSGRWKRELDAAQQHAIAEILAPELAEFGYA